MGARWQREMSKSLPPPLQGRLAGAAFAAKAGAVLAGKELEAAGPPDDSWQLGVPLEEDDQEGEPAGRQHVGPPSGISHECQAAINMGGSSHSRRTCCRNMCPSSYAANVRASFLCSALPCCLADCIEINAEQSYIAGSQPKQQQQQQQQQQGEEGKLGAAERQQLFSRIRAAVRCAGGRCMMRLCPPQSDPDPLGHSLAGSSPGLSATLHPPGMSAGSGRRRPTGQALAAHRILWPSRRRPRWALNPSPMLWSHMPARRASGGRRSTTC